MGGNVAPTITAILCAAQQRLKVPKDKSGHNNRYVYRNLEDINQAVKPILEEMGAAVVYTDEVVELQGGVYIRATCMLIGPEGDTITTTAWAKESTAKNRGMDDPQITGSASSYARKYAACGMFAISGEKDPDELPPVVRPEPEPEWPEGDFFVRCRSCGQVYGPLDRSTVGAAYCGTCNVADWELAPAPAPEPVAQQGGLTPPPPLQQIPDYAPGA